MKHVDPPSRCFNGGTESRIRLADGALAIRSRCQCRLRLRLHSRRSNRRLRCGHGFGGLLAQSCERKGGVGRCGRSARVPVGASKEGVYDSRPVGKETKRTLIRHMYQKLAVHSREELMDLVEEGMPRPDQRTAVSSPVSESIT